MAGERDGAGWWLGQEQMSSFLLQLQEPGSALEKPPFIFSKSIGVDKLEVMAAVP